MTAVAKNKPESSTAALSVIQTDAKISKLHKSAQKKAANAVKDAVQCGALLIARKLEIEHGQWGDYLAKRGIPETTARRYMEVAEQFSKADKHLTEAKSLIELYREFGLVKALEGGGARLGRSGDKTGAGQLFFSFDIFDGIMSVATARTDNPFADVPVEKVRSALPNARRAVEMMEARLAVEIPAIVIAAATTEVTQ